MKSIVSKPGIRRLGALSIGLLYAAPPVAMIVWASQMRSPRTAAAVLVTFVLAALLFAATTRTWRWFFLIQFPMCLCGMAFVIYTIVFAIPPGATLAGILAVTSFEEIQGFIGLPQGHTFALLLGVWTLCYLIAASNASPAPIFTARRGLFRRAMILILIPVMGYAATNPSQLMDGIALEPFVGSVIFLSTDVPRARKALRLSEIHKIPYGARRSRWEEVHVLVVGESVRRDSWSAYGYGRPTTPYMDALRREAIFLKDAVADANFTMRAVPMMLTGLSPEAFAIANVRGNLLDLARESGYTTVWLANQDLSVTAAAGLDPDVLESPMDFSGSVDGPRTFDGDLLPAFRREMARKGRPLFIAIHMIGSHSPYINRYPASFRRFGTTEQLAALSTPPVISGGTDRQSALVDAYDNSILYTDWFLGQIVERARGLTVPATVTFFPDHGEDLQYLDEHAGHGQSIYTRHAFEIPAFVWFNDAYRLRYPEIVAHLTGNATREIRSHDVFYTLADLMGIQWPEADATRSFASDRFVPDTTSRHLAGGLLVGRAPSSGGAQSDERRVAAVPPANP